MLTFVVNIFCILCIWGPAGAHLYYNEFSSGANLDMMKSKILDFYLNIFTSSLLKDFVRFDIGALRTDGGVPNKI